MGVLKAVQSTVLKTDPRKQASDLSAAQKYSLVAGATLTVVATTPAVNNHLQITLATPVQGFATWFVFAPHVSVVWTFLEAVQDTLLKRDPVKQASQLSAVEKAPLNVGQPLPIKAFVVVVNNHLQVTLADPLKGFTTWYAYIPHVRVRREDGAKLEAARDRQQVFNAYMALQKQEGSNQHHLSFLDRSVDSSAYKDQLTQFDDRLRLPPENQTAVSVGASLQLTGTNQTVTFNPYPNRGTIPTIDPVALSFLHPEITEACVCVGSYVNGQLRSRWLGRNATTNAQFWSATKFVPILNTLCQANLKSASTPVGACTIVDSQGGGKSVSFKDAAIDVVSYRKDNASAGIMMSNSTAGMFKRFNSLAGLEAWFRSITGNAMQFRGYYGAEPWIEWPQLRSGADVLVSSQAEGDVGANLVSAYDLTRLITTLGWHVLLPPGAKLAGAQWHSLATLVECLGYDCARYVDAAIATLGIASQMREVVILSKMGFGPSDTRDRTELTFTALVQFVDARHQATNQPAILRTVGMTLRAAVRRVGVSGRRDFDEEARQIDSRMAAEVTEILRRIVTQELA